MSPTKGSTKRAPQKLSNLVEPCVVVVVVVVVGGCGGGGGCGGCGGRGADLCVYTRESVLPHAHLLIRVAEHQGVKTPGVPATLALTSSWTEGEKCLKKLAKKPISVRLDLVDERN